MLKLEQTLRTNPSSSCSAWPAWRWPRWNWREKPRRSMCLLLDESLPRRLASLMVGHDVTSVQRFAGTSISMRI